MLRVAQAVAFAFAVGALGSAGAADDKTDPKGEVLKTVLDVTHEFDKDKKKLTVTAVGQVPTGGWTGAKLTPRAAKEAPKDGVYEFDLTAVRPDGVAKQVISKVKASYTWDNPPADLKGVRVYGAEKGAKAVKFEK